MTPYKKNLWAWAVFMALAFSMGLGGMYLSNWFIVPFFGVVLSAHIFFNRITCPNCGTPVTYVDDKPMPGFRVYKTFFRTKCPVCGWDLNKEGANSNLK